MVVRRSLELEAGMQFRTIGMILLGAMVLPAPCLAQTTPAESAITRTVVAATKLPNLTAAPLHFKAVSVTLLPGEKSSVSAADGILYQISGSTEVSLDSENKMLNAGEGRFIANGKSATLAAGTGGPSTFLHFFLVSAADLGRPAETPPADVKELYRTVQPIPDLKPGSYDLNLTRVAFVLGAVMLVRVETPGFRLSWSVIGTVVAMFMRATKKRAASPLSPRDGQR